MKKPLLTVSSLFFAFLIWMIASMVVGNTLLLPGPIAVVEAIWDIITGSENLLAIGATLLRLILAMAIALILGLVLGMIAGLKPDFGHFMKPIVSILRTVPVISIVVILLIVFGFSKTPYIITFLMIFPLIYQAISDGIKNIDQELVDVYRLEDNHFFTGLRYCYLPLIKESIKTAFLQSAGLGIKVLIMAEYLSQTQISIGNRLYLEKINLNYDYVFAWTAILILIAIAFETIIERYAKKREINKANIDT
ncbi:MAG: ABC transporter permease subunit [Candidatus Izemoplasmatales bacterium]|jgi:NitT/TauT family transport system permease protein|nr:ABC transporter permease subunit [Candidatus Izemoplasmatales bacterium]MDD4595639.1 ABC transporter permease subunit [Candidatus Izemoplasmatales bacterium]